MILLTKKVTGFCVSASFVASVNLVFSCPWKVQNLSSERELGN